MFGIDFTTVGSIRYYYFEDIHYLENHKKVSVYQKNGEIRSISDVKGQELNYTTIIIEDNVQFKKLTIGCKTEGKGEKKYIKDYIKLEMSVAEHGGHNLKPLSMEEYKEKLEEVRQYILKEYKIALNFNLATFRDLEINNTIELILPVSYYKDILLLIAELAPKRYKEDICKDGNRRLNGIYLFNNSQSYKLYDKTKQLLDVYKIKIDGNFLRIEIGLLTSKKIKEVFGTTVINEITTDMLKEYYIKMVTKDLFKRFDKYIKDGNKELKLVAEQEKERDIKKWIRSFYLKSFSLRYEINKVSKNKKDEDEDEDKVTIDLLFDSQQCLDIIKKNTKKNYARAYRNIKNDVEEAEHKKNNLVKYNEIKAKILDLD